MVRFLLALLSATMLSAVAQAAIYKKVQKKPSRTTPSP